MKKPGIAILLIAAAAGGWLVQRLLSEDGPTFPASEIAFTMPDLEGKPHSLAEWEGKARLVNFWATWCAPCRREIPLLKRTQAEHAADDLQVIGVAVDDRKDVLRYAQTVEFNYPVLIGREDAIAFAEASGIEFRGLPFTMVISPDGHLIKTHLGEIAATELAKIIDVLERLQDGELDLAGARKALGRF
ncbi:MAG TPA: TlpA disulfide reductase family protein [Woeseiaceae bacterium]|jgi:thiol-disulfide isomerase/thioredoxin|nr:TlpA disulfide reductase family protein [Woeseiaceae bacterium]